ncbi:hypothetical protein HOLleu_04270 [Holothuria leucospilota]|uniref:Uncharacterized protein n=1 Tax=Holothuria leucospilota TaxID=206669 RepID=A0A9Q1HLS3_HOLLE|nr:hypothetical protein HOLleu_04270 [Holothuria leucospilota]
MNIKEVILDFRKSKASEHAPVVIHGSVVEQVAKYKYLGTRITSNLDWSSNTIGAQKKANQQSLYNERTCSKVKNIMEDTTHPLNSHYNVNRSGFRLCIPRSNRARYRQSFVPDTIYLFNNKVTR